MERGKRYLNFFFRKKLCDSSPKSGKGEKRRGGRKNAGQRRGGDCGRGVRGFSYCRQKIKE